MCRLHLVGPQRLGCFAPVAAAVVAVFVVVVVGAVGDALCWAVAAAAVSAEAVVVTVFLLKATVKQRENHEEN